MSSLPLIAVTSGREHFPNDPHLYIEAIQRAGGLAEYIYPGKGKKDLVAHFDGFLIPGGRDINPLLYREEQRYEINPEEQKRTEFELLLLKEAIRRKKPVLGICYGMQLLNLFFKGTLYQDIQEQKIDSLEHRKGLHTLSVHANPYLKNGTFEVNSSHHQAVKDLGKGLVPFAYSEDGIMEGIYLEGYCFLVGVQWHPERMQNELSQAVFSSFLKECHEQ